jgi:hypothetical protein
MAKFLIVAAALGSSASLEQREGSARAAFVKAAASGDREAMLRLIGSPVQRMSGGELAAEEFMRAIDGCALSFVGRALLSWRCPRGSGADIITVALSERADLVVLGGMSIISSGRPGPPSSPAD